MPHPECQEYDASRLPNHPDGASLHFRCGKLLLATALGEGYKKNIGFRPIWIAGARQPEKSSIPEALPQAMMLLPSRLDGDSITVEPGHASAQRRIWFVNGFRLAWLQIYY